MNVDLQQVLSQRADSARTPAVDPRAVVEQGERLVRRRRTLAVAAAAVVVALTLGTTALLGDPGNERPVPSGPVEVPQWTPGTRPLGYGQGQTLHLADQVIDTGIDLLSLDLTDEGAALTTLDGGIWFTDGATVERIGTTLGVGRLSQGGVSWRVARPRDWVVSGSAGSLLAWMEFPQQREDRPELVVYDSGTGDVLARRSFEVGARNSATVIDVVDRAVFVAEDDRGSFDPAMVLRYDVDTGVLERVDEAEVEDARREAAPALLVGSATDGPLLHSPDQMSGHTVETLRVREAGLDRLVDPRTGDPVEITVPDRYDEGGIAWFTQWLDDDHFALAPDAGLGELLLCRISVGRCDVVVEDLTWDSTALTPGDGLRGAEFALGRAIASHSGSSG